jgi:hypothetical protein
VPSELASYADEVVRRLSCLGDNLVGIYLHGSAAMNAFIPSRSDVDLLVVTDGPVDRPTRLRIADALSERALPCPGVGLEVSIVQRRSVSLPSDVLPFELILDSHEGHAMRVVHGEEREGDPDLVAHVAMARAHGLALTGPDPRELFPAPDRSALLRHFVDDLGWAIEHAQGGYAVLNACRALRFSRDGTLCSKLEGGAWALENEIGDRGTIEAALRRQTGSSEEVDLTAAMVLVDEVRRELDRGGGSPGC